MNIDECGLVVLGVLREEGFPLNGEVIWLGKVSTERSVRIFIIFNFIFFSVIFTTRMITSSSIISRVKMVILNVGIRRIE